MRNVLKYSGQTVASRITLSVIALLMMTCTVWAAPSVTFTSPVNGAAGVPAGTNFQAAFNDSMDSAVINPQNVTLSRKAKVLSFSAGAYHALAVRTDGTIASWRYSGHYIDSRDDIPAGLSGVKAVAAGDYHSVALKNDGTVVAWGQNNFGQLNVPAGLSDVVAIEAGMYHTVALKSDGTVVAWGNNALVPPGLTGVKSISTCNNMVLALKNDGTVVGWSITDGSTSTYNNTYRYPAMPAGLTGVAAISQGWMHALALKCDGTVVAWGQQNMGFYAQVVPPGLSGVKAIAAGTGHSLALKNDGTVVAWGRDNQNNPVSVVPAGLSNVEAIAAGRNFSLGLKDDCTVVGWGGTSTGFLAPSIPVVPDEESEVVSIVEGGTFTLLLRRDGSLISWGNNSYGQGTFPAGLSGIKTIVAGYYHSMALKSDGTVAAWGYNNNGQTNVPAGLTGVKAITAGTYFSVAVKNDGTVVAWGQNNYGQLNMPAGLSGVVAVAATANHTVALKNDGTVAAWGYNTSSQCNVPAGLSGVKAVAAGASHTVALKSDGTVVAWGNNSYGQCNTSGLTGVTDIAAGGSFTVALKSDGTVVVLGTVWPFGAQTGMPTGLSGVRKISGNNGNISALKTNNTVVVWGADNNGATNVPYSYRNANIYEYPISGSVSYDAGMKAVTFTPDTALMPGNYVADIAAVRNSTGEYLAAPALLTFTTENYDPGTTCPCFAQPVYPTCPNSSYLITGTVAGGLGTISCTSPVASGASSTCTIIPDTGYQLTMLTDNGTNVTGEFGNNSYTVSNVTADHAVIATFADMIPPIFPVLPNQVLEATSTAGATATFTVTATDNVDPNPAVTCVPASGTIFALGETTVTCTARDASGNTSTGSFTIKVQDTTPPALTIPADKIVEATGLQTSVDIGQATATDIFPVTIANSAPATYAIGTTSVVWTATDTNSNTVSKDQKITVQDTTPPIVTPPANITIEATGTMTPVAIGTANATDAVGVVSLTNNAPATFPLGTTTVTWTGKDAAGNTGTAVQTVTVKDTTPPVLHGINNQTIEATATSGATASFTVTATDNIDPTPVVTCSATSGSTFALGETTVTCTARDASNNSVTGIFTIKVLDTTPPALSVPADKTVETTGPQTAIAIGQATATDIFPVTITNNAPATYAIGTTTVTWTAKDANNNPVSKDQKITVQDTAPPVVIPPANITIEATGTLTPVAIGTANATDAVGVVSLTNNAPATFPLGTTTVTWAGKDAAGNTGTTTQTVTVNDTTPPVLAGLANQIIEATATSGAAASFTVTATDNIDPTPVVNCSAASGIIFAFGETVVTCTARDASNNSVTGSFTVTVKDTTPPALAVPADKTVEATGPQTTVAIGQATATDIFPVTIANNAPATYAIGTTTVTWTAADTNSNTVSKDQKISVQDTIAPVVTPPANMTVEATGAMTQVSTGTATATDAVGVVSLTSNAPASFPLGDTIVTWTAKDAAGNTGTATQTITVKDTVAPVLAGLANQVLEATSPSGATATFNVTATDIINPAPVVTCSAASGSTFALGENTVTCTARDNNGNTASGSFTIKVQDATPPVLNIPANITVLLNTSLTAPALQAFLNGATATDIVDRSVTITTTPPALNTVGAKVVTFTAVDDFGNKTIRTATIHVLYGCGDTYLNNQQSDYLTPVNLLKPFKLGSTIPVKLHLCDANGIDTLIALPRLYLQQFSGDEPVGDPIEVSSTSGADTGNYFRISGNHYIYNLYTKSLTSGTYQLQAVLEDGTMRTIPLLLKQ